MIWYPEQGDKAKDGVNAYLTQERNKTFVISVTHTKVNNDDDDDDDEKFKRTGEMKIIIERVCMEQLTYS